MSRTNDEKIQMHMDICESMNDLYARKNNDYGNSFAILRKEYPDAILYRLFDKYQRLKTLKSGTTQKVTDESIKDTLRDMANYCILELIEMEIDEDDN